MERRSRPAPLFVSPLLLLCDEPGERNYNTIAAAADRDSARVSAFRSSAAGRRRAGGCPERQSVVPFWVTRVYLGGGIEDRLTEETTAERGMRESERYDGRRELMLREREEALGKEARMMMAPQIVGVLLKKPGQQTHPRLPPLDPQETKIKGESPGIFFLTVRQGALTIRTADAQLAH